MDRRLFLLRTAQTAAGAFVGIRTSLHAMNNNALSSAAVGFTFTQEPLPYSYEALEPSIDRMTMEIHYLKHHAAYVKNVNEAMAAEGVEANDTNELFKRVSLLSAKVRNNAGGAWNHGFFWRSMTHGGKTMEGKVLDAINGAFGSMEQFRTAFADAAMKRFGSGWAWLVESNGKLLIASTPNQDNPLMDVSEAHGTPLLGLDVWEHAYYLKYQNKRDEYINNWWNVVDWSAVAARLG